jgi:hypothetical protein
MKKNFTLLIIAVFLVAFGSPAFAATATNTAGQALTLGGTNTEDLELTFSPQVLAYYGEDGATSPQWYVISTYHSGGNTTYATAQNITSIYKKVDTKSFTDVITTEASASDWSASWTR